MELPLGRKLGRAHLGGIVVYRNYPSALGYIKAIPCRFSFCPLPNEGLFCGVVSKFGG